jgi:translocation and assembly module TamB
VGEGKITFDSLMPQFNIRLNLTKFKIAHNDGIEGHATGFLDLKGVGKDARITGEASLDRLVLSLEELAPVDIPTLPPESKDEKTLTKSMPPYLLMDVLLKAQEIYINGFGINSVWHGNMQVINPVFSPDLLGTITLKRGNIEILGKPMNLKKGTITYDLEKLSDPILKIRATKEHGGEKISLKIEGRASAPQFVFTSSPPLPEEEVLSRLLFGKEISAISPSQSLQLATTVASMNGQNGLNVMDTFRKSLHFDSLELKDSKRLNATSGKEQTTRALSLGKEFGAIKVSIDQGVSTGSKSKATVEMELNKNLTLEGDVGGDRSSGVGITWVKRY